MSKKLKVDALNLSGFTCGFTGTVSHGTAFLLDEEEESSETDVECQRTCLYLTCSN